MKGRSVAETCYECGNSVAWGSGWFVNRVPADVPRGEEDSVADPDGEWLCAMCLDEGDD
jgi:hypothetical protein